MVALYFTWLMAATEPFAWGPVEGLRWEAVPLACSRDAVGVITAHPRKAGLLLAGGRLGGIWRSQNSGRTWQPSETPVAPIVQAFLFHPRDPDRVLAGTVDGILESRNGGMTWSPVRGGLPEAAPGVMTAPVAALTLAPGKTLRVLAGFGTAASTASSRNLGHIYQSDDWGGTWQLIHTGFGNIRSIRFSDAQPMQGIMASALGVFHSINSGTSWRRIIDGLPETGARKVYSMNKPFPGFVLVMDNGARFVSRNNGKTWTPYPGKDKKKPPLPPPPQERLMDAMPVDAPGHGLSPFKAGHAAHAPLERDVFALLTAHQIWITRNNGLSFSPSSRGLPKGFMPRGLAFSRSRKGRVFCWSQPLFHDALLWHPIFTSRNNGNTWEAAAYPPGPTLYDLLPHHRRPLTWLSLTQGTVHKTVQAGKVWSPVLLLPQDGKGGFFTPHPENPNKVLLTWGGEKGGIWESRDWGRNWSRLFPALPHTRGHAVVTSRGEILVCAGRAVWRYDLDRWTPLKTAGKAKALDLAMVNDRFVVAIFGPQPETPAGTPGEVWYSPDYGRRWHACRHGIGGPPPCTLAAQDASEGQLILGTRGGGFYRLVWPVEDAGSEATQ